MGECKGRKKFMSGIDRYSTMRIKWGVKRDFYMTFMTCHPKVKTIKELPNP